MSVMILFFLFLFLVFNLANKVNVEETKKKIELYKKENERLIKKINVKIVSEGEEFFGNVSTVSKPTQAVSEY